MLFVYLDDNKLIMTWRAKNTEFIRYNITNWDVPTSKNIILL
jgi:hypothetical protein